VGVPLPLVRFTVAESLTVLVVVKVAGADSEVTVDEPADANTAVPKSMTKIRKERIRASEV
jgi:hypothetical protein